MDQHSFLFQALVYLSAAVIFVPIAKRLGVGSVLGYLIAGMIIGPFVLGFIGGEGQDIMHYAEFGVVMMLFLIGLDLEPERLWKMRRSIIGLGGLQLIITTVVIGFIAMQFGFVWQHALVLGMIFSMSSTAIVLQTLTEKARLQSVAGQSSFAVLLFQDVAVIPMLALLPLLAIGDAEKSITVKDAAWVRDQPGWLHALIVLGSIIAIIIAGRLLIRPLLRFIAGTNLREIFTAFALLIVTGMAVLMTQVGLSPALGAFLAGVVLANSEYRHELETDLEPFKGLLLGLFFMAVGASINFNLILDQPWIVLSWVLILVFVKSGLLLLLGKLFRISTEQNFIFSLGLSQAGEFAFVLFSLSLEEKVLPAETINLMMAVVAVSMALSPLVIMMNEKFILPRVGTTEEEKEPDKIDEKNPVIIAGFGHFGSTVGRFLRANKIGATYLDLDSDRVDALRKIGFKVFYGDASRYDLLKAAGAAEARIIIITIDSQEKRLQLIETVKKHFPQLHILVRATNRYDAYDQMNAGMLHVYRETLDTSLRVGVDAMTILGYNTQSARRLAAIFFRHDENNLKKLAAIRNEEQYTIQAKKYIEELELIIQADKKDQESQNEPLKPTIESNQSLAIMNAAGESKPELNSQET